MRGARDMRDLSHPLVDETPLTAIRVWLFAVAGLVIAMIVIGGATRLTDSGLSITEWLPLLGAIPPLSQQDWLLAFEKYRQIPEYELVNKGMTLAEFKFIYWWEWAHRFFGRLIGIAYAVPLFVFWLLGRVPTGLLPKLLAILALGGLQGFFGWYMVQSGLVERVDVSHYRLALHLVTAFVILASLLWVAFELAGDQPNDRSHALQSAQHWTAAAIVAVLFLQVIIGAFVAGLKAGLTHNTWPLMDGALIPDGLLTLSPWHLNLIDNETTVQFIHRLLAYLLIGLAVWHTVSLNRAAKPVITSSRILVLAFLVQASLGIWTLLAAAEAAEIPIWLGLVHQGGAAIVLAVAIWHAHRVHRAG